MKFLKNQLKRIKPLTNWNNKRIGNVKNRHHWCRVVMDKDTNQLIGNLKTENLDVLEVSGTKWRNHKFKSYKSVSFPEFDLCKDSFPDTFDLIIVEQVFEHLLYPYKAGKNVYTSLKKGGYFLITTPFLLKVHNAPIDCSRWTEVGLTYFLVECGFDRKNIFSRSWGNKSCVIANLDFWVAYIPSKHSLENDPEFPVVVWALAEK